MHIKSAETSGKTFKYTIMRQKKLLELLHPKTKSELFERAQKIRDAGYNATGYASAGRILRAASDEPLTNKEVGVAAITNTWPGSVILIVNASEADRFFELQQAGELEEEKPKKRIIKKKL